MNGGHYDNPESAILTCTMFSLMPVSPPNIYTVIEYGCVGPGGDYFRDHHLIGDELFSQLREIYPHL